MSGPSKRSARRSRSTTSTSTSAPGEIHAVVGENGAGKSTLIRILGGVHRPDRGEIVRRRAEPADSPARTTRSPPASSPSRRSCGWFRRLSIAENIALGDLPVRRSRADRRWSIAPRMREQARARAGAARFRAGPRRAASVARLCRAPARRHRQGAAPAMPRLHPRRADGGAGEARDRAVCSACSPACKAQGTAIIYISHRLDEVVDDGRPLHDAARRTGRGGEPARRIRRERSRRRHDRPRGAGHPRCRRASGEALAARQPRRRRCASPARGRDHGARRACSAAARIGCCGACSASERAGAGRDAWRRSDRLQVPRDADRRGHWHGAGRTRGSASS